MKIFIANLGSGKGTWGHVTRIINEHNWDKVLIVTNDFGKNNFKPEKVVDYIEVDSLRTAIPKLIDQLTEAFKTNCKKETEVSLNLISGNGKEHMSILSALNKAGITYKLIALTGNGISEL